MVVKDKKPIKKLVISHVKKPVRNLVKKPVKKHVKKPVKKPVRSPVKKPVKKPVKSSAKKTVRSPTNKFNRVYKKKNYKKGGVDNLIPIYIREAGNKLQIEKILVHPNTKIQDIPNIKNIEYIYNDGTKRNENEYVKNSIIYIYKKKPQTQPRQSQQTQQTQQTYAILPRHQANNKQPQQSQQPQGRTQQGQHQSPQRVQLIHKEINLYEYYIQHIQKNEKNKDYLSGMINKFRYILNLSKDDNETKISFNQHTTHEDCKKDNNKCFLIKNQLIELIKICQDYITKINNKGLYKSNKQKRVIIQDEPINHKNQNTDSYNSANSANLRAAAYYALNPTTHQLENTKAFDNMFPSIERDKTDHYNNTFESEENRNKRIHEREKINCITYLDIANKKTDTNERNKYIKKHNDAMIKYSKKYYINRYGEEISYTKHPKNCNPTVI